MSKYVFSAYICNYYITYSFFRKCFTSVQFFTYYKERQSSKKKFLVHHILPRCLKMGKKCIINNCVYFKSSVYLKLGFTGFTITSTFLSFFFLTPQARQRSFCSKAYQKPLILNDFFFRFCRLFVRPYPKFTFFHILYHTVPPLQQHCILQLLSSDFQIPDMQLSALQEVLILNHRI